MLIDFIEKRKISTHSITMLDTSATIPEPRFLDHKEHLTKKPFILQYIN